MRVPWLFSVLLLGCLLSCPERDAAAQTFSVTPTFQASFAHLDNSTIQGRSYHAWGLSMGRVRSAARWSPHLWIQRYESDAFCSGTSGATEECSNDGWSISVGPAIELVKSGRWTGTLYPEMGFDSHRGRDINGGAGLHISVDAGFFDPQVFGRLQSLRGKTYATIGAGVTFTFGSEVQADPTARDPWVREDG